MKETNKKLDPLLIAAVIVGSILVGQSCSYNKEELLYPGSNQPADCTTNPAKFAANVLPLIISKCAYDGCHSATAAGGIVLLNYSQISAAKDRINQRVVVEKTMPPPGPLKPAETNILKCWIESGAPDN